MYQYFPPLGCTRMYSPSPSKTLNFLAFGLRAEISLSLSATGVSHGTELYLPPDFTPHKGRARGERGRTAANGNLI
jgi:hypothetical protein